MWSWPRGGESLRDHGPGELQFNFHGLNKRRVRAMAGLSLADGAALQIEQRALRWRGATWSSANDLVPASLDTSVAWAGRIRPTTHGDCVGLRQGLQDGYSACWGATHGTPSVAPVAISISTASLVRV